MWSRRSCVRHPVIEAQVHRWGWLWDEPCARRYLPGEPDAAAWSKYLDSVRRRARSELQLQHQYAELIERRGVGRARIAMIRRLAGIMRAMLLTGQEFRWVQRDLFERKLREYEKTLAEAREEAKVA